MKLKEIKESLSPFYNKYESYLIGVKSPKKGQPYIMGIGANTFIMGDGESCFMIDAYATRNPFRLPIKFSKPQALISDIESKVSKVEDVYKAIGSPKVSHILCTHNHFDHTLDLRAFYNIIYKSHNIEPTIVGTLSSVNTALGYNIPIQKTYLVERKKKDYDSITIGKFKITFLPGRHLKLFALYKSLYQRTPLKNKGFIIAYKEGGVLDFLIEHENMKPVLLTSSFGMGEYTLKSNVGTLFQAVGGAGKLLKNEKLAIFKQNAIKTGAEKVYLTHYDNFICDFSEGLHFVEISQQIVSTFRVASPDKEIGFIKLFEKNKID